MGAYVYRLKGKKHYKDMSIEGKTERVYDLVYWYKPYFDFWSDKQPAWMKPIKMLEARLGKMFKDVDVKYVCPVHNDANGKKHYSSHVLEWRKGWTSVVDDPDWQGLKMIRL